MCKIRLAYSSFLVKPRIIANPSGSPGRQPKPLRPRAPPTERVSRWHCPGRAGVASALGRNPRSRPLPEA